MSPRFLFRYLFITLSFFLIASLAGATTKADLSSLTVITMSGNEKSVDELKNKEVTYLKFWASWCKPCLEQMPHLQEIQETYGKDIDVIAINIDLNETDENIDNVIKRFDLTLPVAKDSKGELKQQFQFAGTPYHVLLNADGQIIYTSHDADEALDEKIALLAKNKGRGIASIDIDGSGNSHFDSELLSSGRKVLFFTATWCDWYLEDSRPEMSKACIKAQENLTQSQNAPITIVSHMWTDEAEVEKFRSKYAISSPIHIDQGGEAFFTFGVSSFPTFIVLEDGEEVFRTSNFADERLY